MAQEQELIVRLEAGVLWLTLNRPERRNALSPSLYEALLDALDGAARDPAVGAVVLAGAGGAFCAGGDVARMRRQADAPRPLPRSASPTCAAGPASSNSCTACPSPPWR
ncbi:enoyl-CoA hydratase-related protein [Achromobacter denitrificans]